MVRVAFSVLSLLLLGSFAATAAEPKLYRDMDGRFIVNVPEGWTTTVPAASSESEIALMMASSADEKVKGGACFVAVKQMSNTRDAAQAELDEAFGEVMNDKFWKSVFAASGIKDAKIETSGNRMQKGRKVFYVVATVTAEEGAATELATGRQEVHPVPGSLQFVQCVAAKSIYKQMEPAFNAIFASFEPKPNQLIVQQPTKAPPSILTLAATEGGTTRILAQDTANIPALAGTGVTAGIAIAGSGAWEICEGVNFTGTCNVMTGDTAQPLRIGSVRRYIGHNMTDAAAMIAATTTAAFKAGPETTKQAAKR